jgi:proline iminopeptidase
MSAHAVPPTRASRKGHVRVRGANLFCRELGEGLPIAVLHGGPDFDHTYLLPQLDLLADYFRLIYYDQRGRGRSADHVRADEVTIESEIADLDALREHFQLSSIAALGHSWGGVLAMEYAIRRPECMRSMSAGQSR